MTAPAELQAQVAKPREQLPLNEVAGIREVIV